jgi:hypothetical protein
MYESTHVDNFQNRDIINTCIKERSRTGKHAGKEISKTKIEEKLTAVCYSTTYKFKQFIYEVH